MTFHAIDLTCREVAELTTEYLNHGLSPAARATLEQHVFACPSCMVYLDQMKAIVELAGALGQAPAAALEAESGLLRTFRRWKQR